jgi:outer membrane protein
MYRTWTVSTLSLFLWLATGVAQAEFVGFNIPASQLPQTNYESSDDGIELVDDLDIESSRPSSMVLILEHPISALPNVRYRGQSTSNAEASLARQNALPVNKSRTSFDLSQDDIVLYYQLSGAKLDLDLGVDLKRVDGEVSFADSEDNRVAVDETIPLLYLSARYDLSNSGFYVGANINADLIDLGISNSSAQDSTIMLGYDTGSGAGIEGGFKYYSLDLESDYEQDSSLEYDGLYLNGYFNF